MSELDLTPFGFTPTENAVYEALVQRGPSGGYQLSNVLGIARANVYQALRGLVAKDAAIQVGDRPSAFRAVRTDALFTRIANDQSVKLDLLERQLGDGSGEGEPSFVVLESERAVAQVITHHGARSPEPCIVVATGPILRSLQPVWRKRAADSQRTDLWSVGEPADLE
ncbi:MAG: helix-turn-helix domain-containing protein, partial [Gemmatimonadales bacterium]